MKDVIVLIKVAIITVVKKVSPRVVVVNEPVVKPGVEKVLAEVVVENAPVVTKDLTYCVVIKKVPK